MSNPSLLLVTFLYLVVFFLHTQLLISNGVSVLGLDLLKINEMGVMMKRACTQKISESLTETKMDSKTSRRVNGPMVILLHIVHRDVCDMDSNPTRRGKSIM